jgi:hypothetical protein
MGNKYFNTGLDLNNPEYKMVNNFTDEICEMFGIDFIFLPRKLQKTDYLWGEDVLSYFDSYYPITMFVENFSGFEGQGDLFAKFGFQLDDQITLSVQQDRLHNLIGEEPEAGDLIYHPNSKKIFEINHPENEDGFYQFGGGRMMYKFTCTLFESSHEDFSTGNEEIDNKFDFLDDVNNTEEDEQVNTEQQEVLDFSEKNPFGNL